MRSDRGVSSPRTVSARRIFGGLAALLCLAAPAAAADTTFRLGAEDKVRIKVYEWRASQDIVFEWKALNDEFIVGASGTLSLPLAGDVPAAGAETDAVAQLIGQRLQERMHLSDRPDVSISVVQYRPFFVSGDVAKPGSYPYRPGLTVLEAVATAGGVPRLADNGLMRLGREVIDGEGELAQLMLQTDTLLVRRARLRAELDDTDHFQLPDELARRAEDPSFARVVQNETKIFDTRRRAFQNQSATLSSLKGFLIKETESLTAQLATLDTQMSLINKELSGVSTLVEKGMAIAPRQLALERSVAQIQGDRLNMQTNMLRVQAEISRTDIALGDLRNSRSTEDAVELRDVQIKLDEAVSRTSTRKRLLFETEATAPRIIAGRLRREKLQPTYTVVHQENGATTETQADERAVVAPGDTVKVALPFPADLDEAPEAASLEHQSGVHPPSLQ